MIKKDIRDILVYLGLSVRRFLIYLIINFFTFFFVLLLLFAIFIARPAFFSRPINMFLFLITAMMITVLMRSTLILKQKWMLGLGFFSYLRLFPDSAFPKLPEPPSSLTVSLKDIRRHLKDTRSDLKQSGAKWISRDMTMAVALMFPRGPGHSRGKIRDLPGKWRHDACRYFLLKLFIFLLCLIPFIILSLLFSIGIHPALIYLVYSLGFLFATFLYAALFELIFFFFVYRKVFQNYFSEGT
jgi:hypothetical protein